MIHVALVTWLMIHVALVTWVHDQRGTYAHDPIHVILVTLVHDQVSTFDLLCITNKKLRQNMVLP